MQRLLLLLLLLLLQSVYYNYTAYMFLPIHPLSIVTQRLPLVAWPWHPQGYALSRNNPSSPCSFSFF